YAPTSLDLIFSSQLAYHPISQIDLDMPLSVSSELSGGNRWPFSS
ncbi:5109_t:CDS:1, partial [Funneliformis geosporum]